jgi:hypothetical protein
MSQCWSNMQCMCAFGCDSQTMLHLQCCISSCVASAHVVVMGSGGMEPHSCKTAACIPNMRGAPHHELGGSGAALR